MKTKYFLYSALLLSLGLASCQKFLDTKPSSFISPVNYYSNQTQLQTALNSVYDVLTNADGLYGPFGTNIAMKFAFTNDESSSSQYAEETYNFDAGSAGVNTTWTYIYAGIERDNLLLANIDNATIDANQKNIIKGQALFLRGYLYYLAVIAYGDVPLFTAPTTSINGDISVARTPVKQVYAQILSDMTTAESLLGNANFTEKSLGYTEKVTVDAVDAILARVCLTMASPGASGTPIDVSKYQDAVSWANKLINSPDHILNSDYKQIFKNILQDKYDVKESIWEAGLYGTNANEGSSFVYYTTIRNSPGGAQGNAYITRKLYNAYAKWDSVRFNWNCPNFYYASTPVNFSPVTTPIVSPWYMNPGKWRRMYESAFAGLGGSGQSAYNSANFPIIRLADVYLMKAEAENQVNNGPDQAAYDAINAVRRRAFKVATNVPNAVCDLPAGLGKGAFQDSVKAERMRELCFEGVRKWDLVRWGSLVTDMQGILSLYNASPPTVFPIGATLNPIATSAASVTQKHFLLPIPNRELQLNNKLTQNPGW